MIKVKVTTPNPLLPFDRQTPGSKGVWGNCKFYLDQHVENPDWWFVMDTLPKKDSAVIPRERIVLFTSESEEMKTYDKKYLDQFGIIVTSQRQIKHPHVLHIPQGHGWMIGHMGSRSGVDPKDFRKFFTPYDKLKGMTTFKKEKLISVFSSGKSRTPGQKLRLDFIKALKKHFGERLDVFGVNEKYVKDKWDGIAPYKYHISLENSRCKDYWTEKLADSFLGGAYTFYSGAPNIYDYFPKESLTTLDLSDFDKSIELIEREIAENVYQKRQDGIRAARNLILDTYNAFAIMADIANRYGDTAGEKRSITLTPERTRQAVPQIIAENLRSIPVVYQAMRWFYRTVLKKHE